MSPKITIGILSYYDQKYLEQTLPILSNQNYSNYEIIICDNTPEGKTTSWINKNYPKIKTITPKKNLGFSRGHNQIIQHAIANQSQYYLCFNSDIYPTKNYLSQLIKPFKNQPKIAAVTPKILCWQNFPASPTQQNSNTYDSTGIQVNLFHYFKERAFSQKSNQKELPTDVWGFSGASPLISISALQDTQISPNQFFDNDMFMYKEDLDLSYRMRWAGYKVVYQPTAISWHTRSAKSTKIHKQIHNRKNRKEYIRKHSFLNHLQLIYKNWDKNFSLLLKICTFTSIKTYLLYLLLFDRKTLKQVKVFTTRLPKLREKKQNIKKRISAKQMQANFKLI
jgi:GT2 family glycosyltransferase